MIPAWLTLHNIMELVGWVGAGAALLSKLPFISPVWRARLERLGVMAGQAVVSEKKLVESTTASAAAVSKVSP